MKKRILFVVTSHARLGETSHKTGIWLEEFAVPYRLLTAAGFDVVSASPAGGEIPIDPASVAAGAASSESLALLREQTGLFRDVMPLDRVDPDEFAAIFYPGGHGPMWDLSADPVNARLPAAFLSSGKPVAAVCHGPAGLLGDSSFLKGKRVTGFSNEEERQIGLDQIVPFLLEDRLVEAGAIYSKGDPWREYTVTDGLLVTGQNPPSSAAVAGILRDLVCKNK